MHFEIKLKFLNHIIRIALYMAVAKPFGADDDIIDSVTHFVANQLFRVCIIANNLGYDIDGIQNDNTF